MTNLFKVISIAALTAFSLCAQTATTQTTLNGAVLGPSNSSPAPTTICLVSSTGVAAPGFGQPALTGLGIGREYMEVLAATPNTNCWVVARGYAGTKPYAHNSGDTVTVGPTGGFSGSPFSNSAPGGGSGSPCNAATQLYLPIFVVGSVGNNQQNGGVWNCFSSAGVQATTTGLWYQTNDVEDGVALTDFEIFVPANGICVGSTSGTAGAGNNTMIVDGAVPALKVSSTNAGSSNNKFDCNLTAAMRTLTGKGITLTQVTMVYSPQTTTATSMGTPTLGYFQAPPSTTSQTASSATLVTAAGGTLTMTPPVASANLTSVSAGQYYTELIALGTPIQMNTDLRTYVLHFEVDQSASAAQIVTLAGIWLRGTQIPF